MDASTTEMTLVLLEITGASHLEMRSLSVEQSQQLSQHLLMVSGVSGEPGHLVTMEEEDREDDHVMIHPLTMVVNSALVTQVR